ncbi:SEA (Seh1-associated) complex subunit [Marasmius crinis-equi]|uniref:SEA (Seh1-associated) complex subunit n=1 Tax=Marasmius crinis-equi TaxID=585013 RepID=A0ABR3FRB0_9AGAR
MAYERRSAYSNKILTSARNGELIMWDLNKTGSTKYERRAKDHLRSIHAVRVSSLVPNYCLTGSSDGDLRVWDLRDLRKSIIRIHHPTGVRGVVFSPVVFQPLQAAVGLDNGNIFRWDLKIGQRGRLDRIPVAHTASVTALDWCSTSGTTSESTGNGYGWILSGGLDRTVKVWDLTQHGSTHGHIPHKPTYTLHTSFPIRHARWRPSHECEIAIVSNADFGVGSNADMSTPTLPVAGLPSSLQPPSSSTSRRSPNLGLGLDLYNSERDVLPPSEIPRTRSYAAVASGNITPTGSPRMTVSGSTSGAGDLAEIWDVRRGWIAKWQITGSAVDGGLTDICFGADSNAVWGQHYSGMFSQMDLRDATKPIDAVPRVAVGWEAGGGLTFVAGRQEEGEVPYDDGIPEDRANENRKTSHKALGDPSFVPVSQNVGSFQNSESLNDTAVFTKLAKEYILEGEDRREICAYNAQAAFDAGQYQAAQVWLLVEASLATLVPGVTPDSSQSRPPTPGLRSAGLTHSYSAPAGISGINLHDKDSPSRMSDHSSERVNSPGSYQRSLSGGRKAFYTPSSSTNTSPRQGLTGLPHTPLTSSSRRFSNLGRRNSLDPSAARPPPISRRPSAPRRPSNSTYSASPSASSLKHVGEGALDDSDSDSGSEGGDECGEEGSVGEDVVLEEEEPSVLRPLISPALAPLRVSHPSPLSRVAGQRWTEEEGGTDGKDEDEDEASPSPRSTDSELDDGARKDGDASLKRKRPVSSRRSSGAKMKMRSRSSTMASVQTMTSRKSSTKSILRHDSFTSIRTVTASTADLSASMREPDDQPASRLRSDETSRELRMAKSKHSRDKSFAISELVLGGDEESRHQKSKMEEQEPAVSWKQRESILEEEERYREIAWSSLRESIDTLADEGDVQLCAMLAIVVPEELRIRQRRRLAFIDSYIDRLGRLKLHVCAAYVRKYSRIEDIRSLTWKQQYIPPVEDVASPSSLLLDRLTCPGRGIPIVRGAEELRASVAYVGYRFMGSSSSAQFRAMEHVPQSAVVQEQTPSNTSSSENETSTKAMTSSLASISSRASIDTTATNTTNTTNTTNNTEEDGLSGYSTVDASSDGGGALHILTKVSRLVGRPCAAGCGHHCWVAKVSGLSDG